MVLPEPVDGLPEICGQEDLIAQAMAAPGPVFQPDSDADFQRMRSTFAIALHMHQPLIPAGGADLATASIISNLQYMLEHPEAQDSHNAPVFIECYRRMGRFLPSLVRQGKHPRVMLDYSGCLLHGLRQMGRSDVLDELRTITCDPAYRGCVEWLGSAWGHPVAPSTPAQDFRLHVRAWQHHFAALFGLEALARVRGFSPAEMALPNHPDVCYEFVRTLKDCGYRWLLVQEHTVERSEDAGSLRNAHIPHRLIARDSLGRTVAITAIVKTQGSDTKLVGQMQPYYEAKGLSRVTLASRSVPPLVTQIADGENGGVMMNEFPPKYHQVTDEASGTDTPPANVTEYLEYLQRLGVVEEDFPTVQPVLQKRVWDRFADGSGPQALARVIDDLKKQDGRFHMDGGSWTGNISWVRGYEGLLGPMESVSTLFAETVAAAGVQATDPRYRKALFHLLVSQTSCFRYWGEGAWTDYGRELCRRAAEILRTDLARPD
jgi:hypothetical protein